LSRQVEDELRCIVHRPRLGERQVPHALAEHAGVGGADHLAQDAGGLASDDDPGMEAGLGVDVDVGQTRIVDRARRS
jgi:hypothetical protein